MTAIALLGCQGCRLRVGAFNWREIPLSRRSRTKQQDSDGKSSVRGTEIRGEITALTGLRIVAAVWVVLFHFRPMLGDVSTDFRDGLAPVLNCGAQGVDLFFILSGFVLTYNYLDRMGRSWSTRATLHFLWLRLARVWPVYLVTLHIAALWVIFTLHVGHVPSPDAAQLTAISYVRQILLVQLWFVPFFDDSSWDGPAWSISAEWLAYVLFAVMVLVLLRMKQATRARSLMVLAFAASLPPVLMLLASGHFYTPWSCCRESSRSSRRERWPVPRCAGCGSAIAAAASPDSSPCFSWPPWWACCIGLARTRYREWWRTTVAASSTCCSFRW